METNKKLQRIPHEGAVAGVCAGLGEYFGVDKTWIRVGFILTIFFAGQGIGFVGPLLYIILWVVLPVKTLASSLDPFKVDYRVAGEPSPLAGANQQSGTDDYATYDSPASPPARTTRKPNNDKATAGIILLGIGVFFLLLQFDFFHWRDLAKYWPVLLIFMGLVNIVTAFTGRPSQAPATVPASEPADEPLGTEADAPVDTPHDTPASEPANEPTGNEADTPTDKPNGEEPKNEST